MHLEASGSTPQSPVEPGSIVQLGREPTMTPPEAIGYSAAAAAATMGLGQVTPGRYPGSPGGFHLSLAPKSPGMTLEEIKAKQ